MNRSPLFPMMVLVLSTAAGATPPATRAKLKPIVIAVRDMAAGTVVTFDDLSQRSVPSDWATSSYLEPEGAQYVVNQALLFPVHAGDWLTWSMFETIAGQEPIVALCAGRLYSGPRTAAAEIALSRKLVLAKKKPAGPARK